MNCNFKICMILRIQHCHSISSSFNLINNEHFQGSIIHLQNIILLGSWQEIKAHCNFNWTGHDDKLWNHWIDLMHWRHVSITTTPCWGSRLLALRAHVLLAERIGAHPLSQCAHPGQLGGEACRGLPSECMLGDGARGVPRLTPNTTGAPFCDVICIWSIQN